MKRVISAAALLALVGLTAAAVAGGARHASPTKLTVWVGWSAGKELITFKKVAAEYDKAHPDVTLNVVGGIVDQKIVAAIRAGQAPDVVSSFNSYDVGIYCGTKAWLDLKPLHGQVAHQHVDLPAGDAVLHAVRRNPLRAAAARRHLRALLQQGALREGGHQVAAEDDLRADRRCEEADAAEQGRLVEGRRPRPVHRLLRERARAVGRGVRRQVHRRQGQRDPLEAGRVAEDAEVAEEPHRLVRLQQPREVPGGPR